MNWDKDLSNNAKSMMLFLGCFSPTTNAEHKTVKGHMADQNGDGNGKVYLDSGELRELALACNEVADWLDKRAEPV